MQLAINIAVVIVTAYLVWDFVREYRAAVGSTLKRLLLAAKGAAASLWTGFTVIVAVGANGLAYLAELVNEPSVAAAIKEYAEPKVIAVVMIASAVIIQMIKRRR